VCIRVLIADDQPRARRSLNALLTAMRWSPLSYAEQPGHAGAFPVEIVGEAQNGQETLEQVAALQPDVVVMDLHPHATSPSEAHADGLATIATIKSTWPDVKIVVLTMFATDRASVLSAGADAFLLKGCPTQELLEAMQHRGPADSG
jgi:DNA-binding NarL/FixJ family response regulator